jgi:hypothetical protein
MGQAVSMSTPIPPPLRAAAGLAALAIDSARKVPQQLVGLPVLAVSTALQASLKAQQAYAGLVARGDEVLGQLRSREDAPWARFDDEPAAGRPPSAFDAVAEPADAAAAAPRPADAFDAVAEPADAAGGVADGIADALAAEDLADALTAEAAEEAALVEEALVEAALVEEALVEAVDRDLDPDMEADVVPLAEAEVRAEVRAEQAEADAENVFGETEEDELAAADAALAEAGLNVIELDVDPAGADRPNGRVPGSGTEPGTDMPADGMALAADAAAADAVLAADGPLDGYLATDAPVTGYDELSIPQLRGRLRSLTLEEIEALVAYERANRARPAYLTMLENRLSTLRSR